MFPEADKMGIDDITDNATIVRGHSSSMHTRFQLKISVRPVSSSNPQPLLNILKELLTSLKGVDKNLSILAWKDEDKNHTPIQNGTQLHAQFKYSRYTCPKLDTFNLEVRCTLQYKYNTPYH